jgi:catechol 2,3-dioxygenase-like lactoylglutathione lyase family enzyme
MIDHITINVRDLEKSKVFYEKVLATLGMKVNLGSSEDFFWGFGPSKEPEFEIAAGRFFIGQSDEGHPASPNTHIAFRAKDHAMIQAFHAAALAAGGKDNGAPGLRPEYGKTYYAAFVLDPDENNIEAVTFGNS